MSGIADTDRVLVVRTGSANLASVLAGLRRAGAEPELTDDPEAVRSAQRVVLPGVGAFAAAMGELVSRGLDGALRERMLAGRPTLCICLGLQLLARSSEESPGVDGLGVVDAHVTRLADPSVRVPELGWNRVTPAGGDGLLHEGYAYFAHSYHIDRVPEGYRAALTTHGQTFVSAFERGPVLACQFHPELSGAYGLELLRRWLAAGAASC